VPKFAKRFFFLAAGFLVATAIVLTACQAMQWFDLDAAIPETARLLRDGGVLAAFGASWPPHIDWEVERAYREFRTHLRDAQRVRGIPPASVRGPDYSRHFEESGLFRHVTTFAMHHREEGDAERLLDLVLTLDGTSKLVRADVSEEELGLIHLRKVARARIRTPCSWWWTYEVHLALK